MLGKLIMSASLSTLLVIGEITVIEGTPVPEDDIGITQLSSNQDDSTLDETKALEAIVSIEMFEPNYLKLKSSYQDLEMNLVEKNQEIESEHEEQIQEDEQEEQIQENVQEEQNQEESVETEVENEENDDENSFTDEFIVTAYCECYSCSAGYGKMTSTGVIAKEGRTVAVDPDVIPYGSEVWINDHKYIAEDCGGMINGNHIDIFFDKHSDTENWGKQHLKVKVVLKNEEN